MKEFIWEPLQKIGLNEKIFNSRESYKSAQALSKTKIDQFNTAEEFLRNLY